MAVERVLCALWRSVEVTAGECHERILDDWALLALKEAAVEELTVSVAEADQRIYTVPPDERGVVPNCDVLIALGLEIAHDLDDIPNRDMLYAVAREVNVWRVDTRNPVEWKRTWPDGVDAPGIKLVSFMRRADGLTHEQFVRHWTENHTPLARQHHVGLWNYRQNIVRRAYTPGGADVDGIAELRFRSAEDFDTKFFDSDDGRAAIMADVKRFMQKPARDAALMRERALR